MLLSVATEKQKVHVFVIKTSAEAEVQFTNQKSIWSSVSNYYASDYSFAQFMPENTGFGKICQVRNDQVIVVDVGKHIYSMAELNNGELKPASTISALAQKKA